MRNIFRKKKKIESPSPISEERELSFPSLIDNALNDGVTFHEDHFQIQTDRKSVV